MTTSLYIPFTEFVINNEDGQKILYENLVQSGPAYKLIVHESPSWLEIKDKMPKRDMVEILSDKKAQEYKGLVDRFFSPVSDNFKYYEANGRIELTENLTLELRRALSYILIAHDFKARIYDHTIIGYTSKLSDRLLNTNKKEGKDIFPEEGIKRVKFVENLISGYKTESIPTLSINKDPRIFHDLMDLLDKEEIRMLSEKNQLFGVPKVVKDILVRDIQEGITQIMKHQWFPYLTKAAAITISIIYSESDMDRILIHLSEGGAKLLSRFDFRKVAPPFQDPQLFEYGKADTVSLSYKPFNYDYKILIPKAPE